MDTLKTLLEQAETERNQALAAFNQSRARCDAARTQATQLDTYRADYEQRWSLRFTQGAALEIVRCYQGFADRLEVAITQQGHAVTQAQAALARAGDALTAHELRVASVRKLIERRVLAERQTIEQRERKADDEHAMRMALARGNQAVGNTGVRT
ncbi:MAG: flagellar export protein FliJ [Burkholderiaceae bacterium]|nr:flagellar export protein FliJ [Burkholderiaceae bacterium]